MPARVVRTPGGGDVVPVHGFRPRRGFPGHRPVHPCPRYAGMLRGDDRVNNVDQGAYRGSRRAA